MDKQISFKPGATQWRHLEGSRLCANGRTSRRRCLAPGRAHLLQMANGREGIVWEWFDSRYTDSSEAYIIPGGYWGSDRPAYLLEQFHEL